MYPIFLLILSPALALAGFFLVRRFQLDGVFSAEKDFINVLSRVLGNIFGLFLAFCIIVGWGRFLEARRIVNNEVASLSILWRNAAPFPEEVRSRLQHLLTAYTRSVVEDEWPNMLAADQPSDLTQRRYQDIWDFYVGYSPETENQKVFYRRSVSKLNELGTNRRQRLLYCHTTFITPLVAFLFFGSTVMIGISYCFPIKRVWFHALLIAIMTMIVSGGFYLAFELQNPFSGGIVIPPLGFQDLLASFAQR